MNVSDYIKRADALDMFDIASSEDELLSLIKNLPAADVLKNVQGENITEENPVDQFICSRCDIVLEGFIRKCIDEDDGSEWYEEFEPYFCPNCGADMRGGKNDV